MQGKIAIVTGSAHGIGLCIAKKLAEEGALLFLADVSETIKEKATEIETAYNTWVGSYRGNLSMKENFMDLTKEVISRWGKIDILVNNAGGGVILPFLEHTEETLRLTLERNLWTTIWGCYTVIPYMKKSGYGRIINIGADSVRNGLWNHAGYNAAKGGVHGLTTGLAREFADKDITVNCVAPCAVLTDRMMQSDPLRKMDESLREKFLSIIPKGRAANMNEVASVVCFLATDEASFVTGQVISVNGGSTML